MSDYLFQLPLPEAEQFIAGCVRRAIEALGSPPISPSPTAPAKALPGTNTLIRTTDVCRILGISKPTCAQWRKEGKLKFYRLGRFVYFREEEVLAALNQPKHFRS